MVLRRTLPSRVSTEAEAPAVATSASAPQKAPEVSASAAIKPPSTEAQNAAIAAALDEDFPTAAAPAAASLEASFVAPVSAPVMEAPAPTPQPQPVAQPEPVAAPVAAPVPVQAAPVPPKPATPSKPSRPAENALKPKVREKKPRNFAFTPATEEAAPATAAPAMATEASPEVEVSDPTAAADRLETYGLLSEPADVLTASAAPVPATVESGSWDETSPPVPVTASVAIPPAAPAETPTAAAPYVSSNLKVEEPELSAAPESSLPWAAAATSASTSGSAESNDDWGGADWNAQPAEATASDLPGAAPLPPVDIYAPGASQSPYGTSTTPPSLPVRRSSPELPKAGGNPRNLGGNSMFQWGIGAAVVAVVAIGVYQLVKNDASQERVARLTGALTETTERLPTELGGVQTNPGGDLVAPEQVIAMDGTSGILPPPPALDTNGAFQPLTPAVSSTAVIDFADVPPSEANQRIVADGTEQMPGDIGLIAKFQQAVAAEKARQTGEATPETPQTVDQSGLTPAEKEMQNTALQQKLQAELAAYRETLATAETRSEAPKPSEFLRQEDGTTPAPAAPAQTAALNPPAALPAEQANPGNLPILPEPTAQTAPPVRTLSDFDVEAFAADKERVRIPKGIKPRFSSTDFPEMEVLSFVPGRGIIAFNRGREGVLLIGESLEGWELINVAPDSAEFRNGRRTQYVSAD